MLGITLFLTLDAQCTPCNVSFYTYDHGYQIHEKYTLLLRFLIGQIMKLNPIVP